MPNSPARISFVTTIELQIPLCSFAVAERDLRDAILHHILCFVPTKSAVKTSILSKRWKHVWTKVPALDFIQVLPSKNSAELTRVQRFYFKTFVDNVLFLNDSSYLQHLRFQLFEQDCHGISMLYVESATLKTLKVGGNVIEESLQLLKSSNSCVVVKAPNLRCLHLRVFLMEYNICDESFLEEVDITVVDVWVTFEAVYQFSTVRSLRLSTNFAHLLYSEEPLNVSLLTFEK
ncbi:hypothetical protein Cgig2_005860 [Carnegiea gigantea]|uniref:F-box domain-containing protein n=1 Tax=Carnegiea gigantea TaxID=171969 RepID=A0A9Q1KMM7_9CARY|nr:hypothetical protein Cgig2_005860 [Carnegiea gigantea]